jgi:putative polyketide hydroxylase
MMMDSEKTSAIQIPVLVVGGSLVGLSAGLFLAWRGVPTIVLEKHEGSHPHPRAMGYTEHSMEFFRAVGLADVIPQAPADFRLRRARVDSLAGEWHEVSDWTPPSEAEAPVRQRYSPMRGAAIPQDRLEPILRARAVELGLDLRQNTELLAFEQTAKGVSARVRERLSGREYSIQAQYLIAADGHQSPIREALGIESQGQGLIRTLRSVLFYAPEADVYLSKGISQFEIEQPGLKAFLTTYREGRWVLMFHDDLERDEAALLRDIRRALGRDDLTIEIITTGRWELSALICESYRRGRVFLAGDAAHTLPPTRGGFGANTGIDDVYNLAWKLDYVLQGRAGPGLLDSYDAERQPIGWLRHQQTFARPDYAQDGQGIADNEPLYDDDGLELGQLLRSEVVLGAGPELPPVKRPDLWAGQPGTRAPHAWIQRQGQRLSTIDLFTQDFVLLSADARWSAAAAELQACLGIPLQALEVGRDLAFEQVGDFERLFGLRAGGACLVRPDGIMAWRSPEFPESPDRPQQVLHRSLTQILKLPEFESLGMRSSSLKESCDAIPNFSQS